MKQTVKERGDMQVLWVSPTFENLSDLEGCTISRAPLPSDVFSTPNHHIISVCVVYYNHVFEQGLPLHIEESRLCNELCDYCFYLGLFIH